MKIKIRTGIFETNSSSVHSVCIYKQESGNFPETIILSYETYGGRSFEKKANYAYAMCVGRDTEYPVLYPNIEKSYIYQLVKFLNSKGINVKFSNEEVYAWDFYDQELLDELFKDNFRLLEKLLFNYESFITVRDNNYSDRPLPEEEADPNFKENYIRFELYDS